MHVETKCVACDRTASQSAGRCTNGCCNTCHVRFCTSGGQTSPGHYLDLAAARREVAADRPRLETDPRLVALMQAVGGRPFTANDWLGFAGCESREPWMAEFGHGDVGYILVADGDTLEFYNAGSSDALEGHVALKIADVG